VACILHIGPIDFDKLIAGPQPSVTVCRTAGNHLTNR
jgi:hypothetical protein